MIDLSDAEEDFKSWLVAEPDLASLHGGRVYWRIPNQPSYPLVRLYRAGGGKQPGEANMRDIRFGVEVLGGAVDGPTWLAVRTLTTAIESVVDNLDNVAQGGTMFCNGIVTGVTDKPDPDTGRPGRVLDALITCRSLTS